jgi:hypothetical protein
MQNVPGSNEEGAEIDQQFDNFFYCTSNHYPNLTFFSLEVVTIPRISFRSTMLFNLNLRKIQLFFIPQIANRSSTTSFVNSPTKPAWWIFSVLRTEKSRAPHFYHLSRMSYNPSDTARSHHFFPRSRYEPIIHTLPATLRMTRALSFVSDPTRPPAWCFFCPQGIKKQGAHARPAGHSHSTANKLLQFL